MRMRMRMTLVCSKMMTMVTMMMMTMTMMILMMAMMITRLTGKELRAEEEGFQTEDSKVRT